MPTVDFDKLTIMNDFMFGTVMRKEEFCKPFLETILGVKIRARLPERTGADQNGHSRLPRRPARRIWGGRSE